MEKTTLRTTLIALASILLVPGFAAAQEGPRRGPDPERMLECMEQRLDQMKGPLNLNQRQEARIRAVLRRGASEAQRVLEQHPERGPERREALRQIRWQADDDVHAVLTCEQRERFRRLRREYRQEHRGEIRERRGDRRQRRQGRRQGHRGGSAPDGGI